MTPNADYGRVIGPAERVIKALPGCLTRQALLDIQIYLACELEDDEAVDTFRVLASPNGRLGADQ